MTLLKAYLVGSNDPFVLARVYHDEYILKDAKFIKDYIDEQMKLYRGELKAQEVHLDELEGDISQSIANLRTIHRNYEVNIWAEDTTWEKIAEQAGQVYDSESIIPAFRDTYEEHRKQFKEDMDNIKELRKVIPVQKKLVKELTQEFEKKEKELYSKYGNSTKEDYDENKFGLEFEKLGLKLLESHLKLTKRMAEETVDEKGVPVLQVPDSKAVMNINKKFKAELDKMIAENEKDIADSDKPRSATKLQPKKYVPLMDKWGKALKKVVDDESGAQYFKKYYTDKIKDYERRIKRSKQLIKALESGKQWTAAFSSTISPKDIRETELTGEKELEVESRKKKTFADIGVIDSLKVGFPTKAIRNTFYNELSAWVEAEPKLFNIPVITGYKQEGRDKTHSSVEEGGSSARNRNLLRLKEIFESAPAGERNSDMILRIINTELNRVKETPVSARKEGKQESQQISILDWYKNLDIKLTKLKEKLISIKGKALPQVVKGNIRTILNLQAKSLGTIKGGTPVKKVLLAIGGRSIRESIIELHPVIGKKWVKDVKKWVKKDKQLEEWLYKERRKKKDFLDDLEKLYTSIKSTINYKVEGDTVLEYIINVQTKRKVPQFIMETEEDIKALEDVKIFLQRSDIKGLDDEDENTLEDILKELVSSYNRLIGDENLATLDKEGKAFKEILSVQLPKAQKLIGKMPEQHEKKKELIEAFRNLTKAYGSTLLEISGTKLTAKVKNEQMVERVVDAYYGQLKNLDKDEQRKFLNAMLPFKKSKNNEWINKIMSAEKETANLLQELQAIGKLELGAFAEPRKAGRDFLDVSGMSENQLNAIEEQQGREAGTAQPKQFTEVGGDYSYEGESAKDPDKELEDARIREEEYEQAQEDAKIREEQRQEGKHVEEPEEEQPEYELDEEEYGAGDLTEEYGEGTLEDDES